MTPITKEQAVQLARDAGFDVQVAQGLKNPEPDVFAANVCVTKEVARLIKLARNQALEEARHLAWSATCNAGDEYGHGYNKAAAEITRAIESLKDNT